MQFVIPEYYCLKYKDNLLNTVEISKILEKSDSTIMRFFKSNGITRNYNNKEWLNKKYNIEKLGIGEISKLANCNTKTINKKLKEFNLLTNNFSIRSRKNSYNLKFFNKIDTAVKAYWLGFMYADGGLDKKCYRLSFRLSRKDTNHLIKIKNLICPEKDIIFTENLDEKTKKTYLKSELCINNIEIYKQLLSIGCIAGDKHNYNMPDISEELIHHFIRGYFDGDGCISIDKKNQCNINIVGSEKILAFIASHLKNVLYTNIKVKKVKDKNLFVINIGGNIQCDAVMHYMYKDSNSNIYLERKYEKWYKNYITHNRRYSLIFAEMQRVREKLPNPTIK